MTYLLGIDIGTSSAKAVLFDPESAQIAAVANQEYPIQRPAPDRAEQDPEDWWRATVTVTRRLLAERPGASVVGISFSGQMHGTVLLDAADCPLRPAIIWADQRPAAEVSDLVAALGEEAYAALTGTLPAVGFLGATLLWLQRHEPATVEAARVVLLPKDYVRLKMTGERATDVTDAAGTGIFDINRRVWPESLLSKVGLRGDLLPPIRASAAVAGFLRREAADEMGLPPGLPVMMGCADQPAQAIGNGLIAPGSASVTTGSGGQVFTPVTGIAGRIKADPRLHVFNHAAPDTWYIMGAVLSAGLSLRWLRGIVGLNGNPEAYPILSAEAAEVAPGADGLIFLPYLSGERTPHRDPLARGAFIGLSAHHTRGHLARAVMEGVSFALRQALEISLSLGGSVERIIAAGGGAESDVWRQIQADVFGLPLQRTLLTEQASVGAALLAGVGAGVYADLPAACAATVRLGAITEPMAANRARYDDLYAQFLSLYPRLREDFHQLAR